MRKENQVLRKVYWMHTVVRSKWAQVWEPMDRETLFRNGRMSEETRTKLVTLTIDLLDLRLEVTNSKC